MAVSSLIGFKVTDALKQNGRIDQTKILLSKNNFVQICSEYVLYITLYITIYIYITLYIKEAQ